MSDARPVSTSLEAYLLAELTRHPILVWLDPHDAFTPFVDALASRTSPAFAASVVAHRGSYLETMIRLEPFLSRPTPDPPLLLLHVPRHNDESIKDTPLYEIRLNGYRVLKSLETVIRDAARGHVTPDEVEAFLAAGQPTLADADAWMATKVAAASGELAAMLRGLRPPQLYDDLLTEGPIAARLAHTREHGEIWHYLAAHLDLRDDWAFPEARGRVTSGRVLADVLASWALCVEYAHDLQRPTVAPVLAGLRTLERPFVEACREVARQARAAHPDAYARLAVEVEELIEVERQSGTADDLGRIDTFRFEEEQLLAGATAALLRAEWSRALAWAEDRLDGKSFWLDHDPTRKSAWVLVRAAAQLGLAVAGSRLDYRRASSLAEAAELYVEHGANVDRLHRQLEQACESHLYRRVPLYHELRAALDAARAAHAGWADAKAREWSDLCQREGALPSSDLQQRRIFDDVVRPLLDDADKTALLLVDALRFEMVQELLEQIGKPAASAVHLRPRLCELPSVTEVGMSVLAPVADGIKLRPLLAKDGRRFEGFVNAAGFRVAGPPGRKDAIARRAGGTSCPWIELPELLGKTSAELRSSIRQARLVVVHSLEIDAAGEKGSGPSVFAGAIRKLHKAWKLLRDAGVQRFVVTSDHGFLLRAPTDPSLSHGKAYEALARYALHSHDIPTEHQLSVPLRSLEYVDAEGYLLLPRGLEVYQAGRERSFVHGGNSPQERIIPVLTLVHKRPPGSDDLRYVVRIERHDAEAGLHVIAARIEPAPGQTGLSFVEATQLDLDLRVVGGPTIARHLVQVRGSARLDGDVAQVGVGASFELLFRLTGPQEGRVPVELFHPSGTHAVEAKASEVRFLVEAPPAPRGVAASPVPSMPMVVEPRPEPPVASAPASGPAGPVTPSDAWLLAYEDPGVRKVFAHIDAYSAINEAELVTMLGSPRLSRKFSRDFEELAQRAPFVVRIDFAAGTKRYVKESQRK